VDWYFTPVERVQDFQPSFCPRKDCPEHLRTTPGYRFTIHAYYKLKNGRTYPRFRCSTCKSSYSIKAFSPNYYLKRPELLPRIAAQLQACSAHRQISRSLGCAPSTVTRMTERLGRHCMLLHERALQAIEGTLDEPVVFDHFVTFEFSQDLPFGVGTAVGADSWFLYTSDPAPHPRTGRRSPAQQKRLDARPPRDDHGGYTASAERCFRRLLRLKAPGKPLHLIVDDHPAYPAALARLEQPEQIRLEVHPNPPRGPKGSARSAEARARDKAMFPVDSLHSLIRHSAAAHKRETIAFGRRINALMERTYVFLAWRNFIKGRSERKPDPSTPAMRLGLTARPWRWRELLARRLFPAGEGLQGVVLELYRREWTTPVLPRNRRHDLKLAY